MTSNSGIPAGELATEISHLQRSLVSLSGKEYKEAILRLKYLRNKQIQIRKKSDDGPFRKAESE